MKITRRQLRKIIKESINEIRVNAGMSKEQDRKIPAGSIASVDWIKFHDDPYYDTNPPDWLNNPREELEAFLDLLISSELRNVLNGLGIPELYRPAMDEIDYEGIFNGGKAIMSILQKVFPNTNQGMLDRALQQWAVNNTGSGKIHPGPMS